MTKINLKKDLDLAKVVMNVDTQLMEYTIVMSGSIIEIYAYSDFSDISELVGKAVITEDEYYHLYNSDLARKQAIREIVGA